MSASSGGAVRAVVSESDGVVSATVEESNRVRAQLGLKPLRLGNDEGGKYAVPTTPELSAAEKESLKYGAKLKASHEKLVAGESLASSLFVEDEDLSPRAWVAKHRVGGAKIVPQQQSGKLAKLDTKEKRATKKAAEIFVDHDVHELQGVEGEVVLTLKDRRIIGKDGELDNREDELEEQNLMRRRQLREGQREKKRQTVGRPEMDLEDEQELGSDGLPKKKEILEQYDEWLGIKPKTVKGFRVKGDEEEMIDRGDQELQFGEGKQKFQLDTKVTVQSDFYTSEELEMSFKPRKHRGRKRQKTDDVDWDDIFGAEGSKQGGTRKHTHSNKRGSKEESPPAVLVKTAKLPDPELFIDGELEDDRLLYDHLSRQRQKIASENVEGQIHQLAAETASALAEVKAEEPTALQTDADSGLELTSTTEFCRSVQTPLEKLQMAKNEAYSGSTMYWQQRTAKSQLGGISVAGGKVEGRGRRKKEKGEEVKVERTDDDEAHVSADDEGATEEEEGEAEEGSVETAELVGLKDDTLGGGLAGALAILKERGQLNDDVYRVGRRNRECRPMHTSTGDEDIKLDNKDHFGRVMTQKEAFRQISWIFHGKGPGKKKRETMLKRMELEKKLKSMNPTGSQLKTMRALQKSQQKLHVPHIVLSSGSSSSTGAKK